jgi:hypothetical protein
MSGFPRLFCFIAFSGVSQRWQIKKIQKTFCKKIVSKRIYTKNRQKIQNRFFLDFLLSRFWALLGEGSSKTPLKSINKNLALVLFLASDPPTHPPRGSPALFQMHCLFGVHLALGAWRPLVYIVYSL